MAGAGTGAGAGARTCPSPSPLSKIVRLLRGVQRRNSRKGRSRSSPSPPAIDFARSIEGGKLHSHRTHRKREKGRYRGCCMPPDRVPAIDCEQRARAIYTSHNPLTWNLVCTPGRCSWWKSNFLFLLHPENKALECEPFWAAPGIDPIHHKWGLCLGNFERSTRVYSRGLWLTGFFFLAVFWGHKSRRVFRIDLCIDFRLVVMQLSKTRQPGTTAALGVDHTVWIWRDLE